MTIYAIFSDQYMPQFSDFWSAFSSLEKAIEALMKVPNELITKHRLEVYEIFVDSKDLGKKRLNADDPRIVEIAKQVASRRCNSS